VLTEEVTRSAEVGDIRTSDSAEAPSEVDLIPWLAEPSLPDSSWLVSTSAFSWGCFRQFGNWDEPCQYETGFWADTKTKKEDPRFTYCVIQSFMGKIESISTR